MCVGELCSLFVECVTWDVGFCRQIFLDLWFECVFLRFDELCKGWWWGVY